VRSVEGGNSVDEGTLALGDCEANLAHEGENWFGDRCGEAAVPTHSYRHACHFLTAGQLDPSMRLIML